MFPVLTTLTPPRHTALTTLLTVKNEVELQPGQLLDLHDTVLSRYIRQASDTIVRLTRRPWARARYREILEPLADGHLWPSRTPIVAVEALGWVDRQAETTEAITDYDLFGSEGIGLWDSTTWHRGSCATGYQVDYTAGYLLPDDDYTAATLSFEASDGTLHDSASALPLLAAGDTVVISGAAEAGNNVMATVTSRTASVLTLADVALTDEVAGASVTLTVRTLPEDVELACIELVKAQYFSRQFHLTGPRVLDTGAGTQVLDDPAGAIPRIVWQLLRPWREVYV